MTKEKDTKFQKKKKMFAETFLQDFDIQLM